MMTRTQVGEALSQLNDYVQRRLGDTASLEIDGQLVSVEKLTLRLWMQYQRISGSYEALVGHRFEDETGYDDGDGR